MDDNIFSKELQEEFIQNIKALKENAAADPGENSPKTKQIKPQKKKTGRKNRGLTQKSYAEYKEQRKKTYNDFMQLKSPDTFNADLIEHVTGEIINENDLTQFKELYTLTCDTILTNFKQNNPDLIKKHAYFWFKNLLLEIKKNVPRITADDIERCFIVWDCLAELLYSIGLYPTFELFQYMTNIYKYQLKDREKLSPRYTEFLKKITNDSDAALISEIATNPYNQTNKIFLAKVHGIIEKTEPKQIEVTHTIRNYDTLPMFNDENGENS